MVFCIRRTTRVWVGMVLFSFRLFFTIISYFSFAVIPVINCSHICSPFYRSYCETDETSEIFEISGTFWTSETTHLICLFFYFLTFPLLSQPGDYRAGTNNVSLANHQHPQISKALPTKPASRANINFL